MRNRALDSTATPDNGSKALSALLPKARSLPYQGRMNGEYSALARHWWMRVNLHGASTSYSAATTPNSSPCSSGLNLSAAAKLRALGLVSITVRRGKQTLHQYVTVASLGQVLLIRRRGGFLDRMAYICSLRESPWKIRIAGPRVSGLICSR